jgi:transposase-like protein
MLASTVLLERRGPMKRSRFSEEQVVYALRQVEASTSVSDLCRQLEVAAVNLLRVGKEVRAPGRRK